MKSKFKALLFSSVLMVGATGFAHAEPNVVASIKPVHSLVAGVMQGVGTPSLIVDQAGSPHTYSLKPSQAAELQNADVVFWVGHDLETFLEKPLETVAADAQIVELIDTKGLKKLDFREGGAFDSHDHGDHADHGHEEAKAEHAGHDHDDHDHGHKEVKADHAGHDHDDHGHGHEEHANHDDHDHGHKEAKAEHAGHDHDDHRHGHEEHASHDDHDHGHEEAKAEHGGHDHDDHGHGHEEHASHDHDEH
ncbi:MAG: zinc ABC transporter substrate-binding protein, partial [Pseudomonadota bacterium]